MTLEEMYTSVTAILEDHNRAIGGPDEPGACKPDLFLAQLKAIGGTSADRLRGLSYEDILAVFDAVGPKTKPVLLAKAIAQVFRGKDTVKRVSSLRASTMGPRELLEAFDPTEQDSAIGSELKRRSSGGAFLVYTDAGSVDVDSSLKLFEELRLGYAARDLFVVAGVPQPVYAIGARPDVMLDENPLWPARPLRPDGTCDQTNRSWTGITLEFRQRVRCAVLIGELDATVKNAHDIMDMGLAHDGLYQLMRRYPKAAMKYAELLKVGNLPSLKIKAPKTGGAVVGSPFSNSQRVRP